MIFAQSKFGNIKKEYKGRIYDSTREANYARDLDLQLHGKDILAWQPQIRIPLWVNGVRVAYYVADFLVVNKDNEEEIHEVKGMWTPMGKLKWKLVQAIYGDKYNYIIIR